MKKTIINDSPESPTRPAGRPDERRGPDAWVSGRGGPGFGGAGPGVVMRGSSFGGWLALPHHHSAAGNAVVVNACLMCEPPLKLHELFASLQRGGGLLLHQICANLMLYQTKS